MNHEEILALEIELVKRLPTPEEWDSILHLALQAEALRAWQAEAVGVLGDVDCLLIGIAHEGAEEAGAQIDEQRDDIRRVLANAPEVKP